MYPRVLRGRLLRLRAMRARSAAECTDRSVPLGRYWRSRPLVFSFDPRCQGLCGSQKYTWTFVAMVSARCAALCITLPNGLEGRLKEQDGFRRTQLCKD